MLRDKEIGKLEEKVTELQNELKVTKDKLAKAEKDKEIEEHYRGQIGNGGPPYPHF